MSSDSLHFPVLSCLDSPSLRGNDDDFNFSCTRCTWHSLRNGLQGKEIAITGTYKAMYQGTLFVDISLPVT